MNKKTIQEVFLMLEKHYSNSNNLIENGVVKTFDITEEESGVILIDTDI